MTYRDLMWRAVNSVETEPLDPLREERLNESHRRAGDPG